MVTSMCAAADPDLYSGYQIVVTNHSPICYEQKANGSVSDCLLERSIYMKNNIILSADL